MTADNKKDDLRRNPVAEWVAAAIEFARANRAGVLGVLAAVVVGSLLYAGYQWYLDHQETAARQAMIGAQAKLRGVKPGESGNLEEGMKLLQEVAQKHAGTASAEEALLRVGNIQYERQKIDEALATYGKYLQEYPRGRYRVMAAISKAYAEESQGKPEAAAGTLRDIATSMKDDPLVGEALLNLGRLLEVQKKTDDAIKTYGQVSERFPGTQWAQTAIYRMATLRGK